MRAPGGRGRTAAGAAIGAAHLAGESSGGGAGEETGGGGERWNVTEASTF